MEVLLVLSTTCPGLPDAGEGRLLAACWPVSPATNSGGAARAQTQPSLARGQSPVNLTPDLYVLSATVSSLSPCSP